MSTAGTQFRAQVATRTVGQHPVEQEQIVGVLRDQLAGVGDVLRVVDSVPLGTQVEQEIACEAGFVFEQEDAFSHGPMSRSEG